MKAIELTDYYSANSSSESEEYPVDNAAEVSVSETTKKTGSNWVECLPADIKSDIQSHFQYQDFCKGEVIYQQTSAADKVYFIVEGQVSIVEYSPEGKEHVHVIYQKGDAFGDLEVIGRMYRCTATVAKVKTRLGVVSCKDFANLRRKHPEMDSILLTSYSHQIRTLLNWLHGSTFFQLPQRVANRLHAIAKNYGHAALGENSWVDIDLTQEDLAKMLSAARQSISKVIKRMESEGILKVRYRVITIFDMKKLKDYCNSSFN